MVCDKARGMGERLEESLGDFQFLHAIGIVQVGMLKGVEVAFRRKYESLLRTLQRAQPADALAAGGA